MGTKVTKSVFDAIWNAFNAVFSQTASTELIQNVVLSDTDANPNSITYPTFQKWVGITYIEPASFQTSTLLGIGGVYSSNIEDALSQPNIQILARGSHAYTITVNQYRDAAWTQLLQTNTFTRLAGVPVLENMQITGNYVKVTYTNTSGSIMTETLLYASLGILPLTVDTLWAQTIAKSVSTTVASDQLWQKASAASMPVVIASDYEIAGKVLRTWPIIAANAARNPVRTNQFYEPIVAVAKPQQYAVENTFWVAPINPTINTPVALGTATATAYVGTAPSILIRNAATANGKDIYINAFELSLIGAGTGLTDLWMEVHIDTTNRYTSGWSAITGKTLYSQSATTAFTAFNASTAIVATADWSTFTRLFRRKLRTVAPVAWDVYKIIFDSVYDWWNYALNQTVPGVYNIQCPVCIIPPVGTLLVYIFATGMTVAPTWEWTIEFTER